MMSSRPKRTLLRNDLNNGLRYSAEVCCVAEAILPCVERRTASVGVSGKAEMVSKVSR